MIRSPIMYLGQAPMLSRRAESQLSPRRSHLSSSQASNLRRWTFAAVASCPQIMTLISTARSTLSLTIHTPQTV